MRDVAGKELGSTGAPAPRCLKRHPRLCPLAHPPRTVSAAFSPPHRHDPHGRRKPFGGLRPRGRGRAHRGSADRIRRPRRLRSLRTPSTRHHTRPALGTGLSRPSATRRMTGRPGSRCTAYALHLGAFEMGFQNVPRPPRSQMIPRRGGNPRRHAFKPPYPQAHGPPQAPRTPPPASARRPAISASSSGPDDLSSTEKRACPAHHKRSTWKPMSAHGLMYTVISNAHGGDPYQRSGHALLLSPTL